jgi:hypothetical protein
MHIMLSGSGGRLFQHGQVLLHGFQVPGVAVTLVETEPDMGHRSGDAVADEALNDHAVFSGVGCRNGEALTLMGEGH